MFRAWRIKREVRLRDSRRLRYQLILEKFVKAIDGELHRIQRRPSRGKIIAEIGLRFQLRIVAERTGGRDEEIANLRRAIAGCDPRLDQPIGIGTIDQRPFGSDVIIIVIGRCRTRRQTRNAVCAKVEVVGGS